MKSLKGLLIVFPKGREADERQSKSYSIPILKSTLCFPKKYLELLTVVHNLPVPTQNIVGPMPGQQRSNKFKKRKSILIGASPDKSIA